MSKGARAVESRRGLACNCFFGAGAANLVAGAIIKLAGTRDSAHRGFRSAAGVVRGVIAVLVVIPATLVGSIVTVTWCADRYLVIMSTLTVLSLLLAGFSDSIPEDESQVAVVNSLAGVTIITFVVLPFLYRRAGRKARAE